MQIVLDLPRTNICLRIPDKAQPFDRTEVNEQLKNQHEKQLK